MLLFNYCNFYANSVKRHIKKQANTLPKVLACLLFPYINFENSFITEWFLKINPIANKKQVQLVVTLPDFSTTLKILFLLQ